MKYMIKDVDHEFIINHFLKDITDLVDIDDFDDIEDFDDFE